MPNHSSKGNLNTLDVLVVAFGAMIGWGWVVSSGLWITTGGALGTAIAFLIGGIMIYYVGLVYAELTTLFPVTGGAQIFSYVALGPVASFICTWALVLSYVGVVCFEAVSFPTIIQYIYPGFLKGYLYTVMGFDIYFTWLLVAVFTALFTLYINIKGTKFAARVQTVFTIGIALVGLLLMIGSVFTGKAENIEAQLFVGDTTPSVIKNVLKVAIMTPFFLFGFDVIPQTAEEIKIPLKRLGKIMILSIVMAVAFYALIVLAVGYSLNHLQVVSSMNESGLVTASAMEVAFSSDLMAKVLILGGLCGIVTSWNSFLMGGSRILFAMAKSYMLPQSFTKVHARYNTPIVALGLLGLLSVISVFFGRPMFVWIVNAANFACCLAYCIVSLSFLKIRKKYPTRKRPYRVRQGMYVGFMAVVISGCMALLYLIPGTNCSFIWEEWIIVGIWIVLGIYLGVRSKRIYKDRFASGMDVL